MSKRKSVGLIYFVVIMLTLVMRVASALDIYSALGIDDSDVLWTCTVQILFFGVTSIALYSWSAYSRKESVKDVLFDFGVKRIKALDWLIILGICVCTMAVSTGISFVWQVVLQLVGFTHISSSTDYSTVALLFKELALTALLPGVCEEIAHRGLIYAGYKECKWKFVIVSALLFSLMHQNIVQTGYTFFFGASLALIMYYTGSIWGGIFIHFANNAWVVLSGYSDQHPDGALGFIAKIQDYFYSSDFGFLLGIMLVVLCAGLLVLFFYLLRKRAEKAYRVGAPFDNPAKDVLPLYKDIPLWVTIVVGVAATLFSLVWGLTR